MTLKVYIGTAEEITQRLASAPDPTTTAIDDVTSHKLFTVLSTASFAVAQSVVVGKQKAKIAGINSNIITLEDDLLTLPTSGTKMRHYDADYSRYRDQSKPFTIVDDQKTGGGTGDPLGQDLLFNDYNGLMPDIVEQNRISIFDSVDPDAVLFSGVITISENQMVTKNDQLNPVLPVYQWEVESRGYQWEADSVGIEEQPFTNINAGDFIKYLMTKWTNLSEGFIDVTNSPRIDYIRLANQRRFSDVGRALATLWNGSEFYIENTHTGGKVYFRQKSISNALITLSEDYMLKLGNGTEQRCNVRRDYEKVFNIVNLPYYREQSREPDFHVQSTTADEAFLKTSVTLAGQPSALEESQLLLDDFSDGDLDTDFTEDDIDNPSPQPGFNADDGYLVEGTVNQVDGLHMLSTSGASPAIKLGDIGRITDPGEVEPFTGQERQVLFAKELVVNTLGNAVVLGIIDQTTIQTVTKFGSTSTRIYVNSVAGFAVDDRISIAETKAYIQAIGADYFDLYDAITIPGILVEVTKHRLAKSRIKFGVYFKSNGDLKYIKDGAETAFSTPRTYTAAPSTYSLRLSMQAFESTITGGITSTGCTLNDASKFTTGDVVEIYTSGSRSKPEIRIITKSGSNISYEATERTPAQGYRVRTMPKMVLEIKGGSEFGSITGRDWTTIYSASNTWQTTVNTPDDYGVIVCMPVSLVATLSLFQMKNPVPITANTGQRYLHIGTQEIDSSEPDVDCIIRKVGSHFQLDFFPDTKSLWASGETLELRYKERWKVQLESKDTNSMRAVAKNRGYTISESATEQELVRKGGRALDSIELLPNPLSDSEALSQNANILSAVSSPAVTVEIRTNTFRDSLCRAGQILPSTLANVSDIEIKRVEITEIPGIQENGSSLYLQTIIAGSIDRLSDVLKKRILANNGRLILDDGVSDDTYSKLQKVALSETAKAIDNFITQTCSQPSLIICFGNSFNAVTCLMVNSVGFTGGEEPGGDPLGIGQAMGAGMFTTLTYGTFGDIEEPEPPPPPEPGEGKAMGAGIFMYITSD